MDERPFYDGSKLLRVDAASSTAVLTFIAGEAMNITIYHNPSCSKSRKTLEIIRGHGIEPRIVEYLKTPPDARTILKLAGLLQVRVEELFRKSEPEYEAATRDDRLEPGNPAMAEWLARHPKVMQRPIVVDEERNVAVIGRPPEAILGLLSEPGSESSAGS
jgi:arsenate reductase